VAGFQLPGDTALLEIPPVTDAHSAVNAGAAYQVNEARMTGKKNIWTTEKAM
jgi:hypothetical protein